MKEIEVNSSNPHVTLITGEGCEKEISINTFNKEYTGISLSVVPGQNPNLIISNIVDLQKKELEKYDTKFLILTTFTILLRTISILI